MAVANVKNPTYASDDLATVLLGVEMPKLIIGVPKRIRHWLHLGILWLDACGIPLEASRPTGRKVF